MIAPTPERAPLGVAEPSYYDGFTDPLQEPHRMTLHPPDLVAWSAWKVLVIVVDAIAVIVGTLGGVAGISSARCSFPRLMELRAIRL